MVDQTSDYTDSYSSIILCELVNQIGKGQDVGNEAPACGQQLIIHHLKFVSNAMDVLLSLHQNLEYLEQLLFSNQAYQ